MKDVTVKQLRYFEALIEHGHFGRAADVCAISQPALSMQIKELEETLGAPLFERSARQVRLTHFGAAVAERARAVLRSVEELQDLARVSASSDLSGRMRIGVIPTIAPYLIPKIIGRLTFEHENLDVRIRETQTQKLVQELTQGKLDMAIVALPVSEPSLNELPLFEEDFVLVRHNSDADKPVPSAENLNKMRLLLLEEGHCFRDQALSFCKLQSTLPRELLDGSSLTTLVQMVGAGMGVTLIPEMAVPIETRSAPVTVQHFADPVPKRTIGMVWRKSSPLAKQMEQIADVVKRAAAGA